MDSILEGFSNSYSHARTKFLAACDSYGMDVESIAHPSEKGPDGETLYIDVASWSMDVAKNVLMICSGTHGVEGFCGSAVQSLWLQQNRPETLPKHTGVLMVHGLNPFGFAWCRRVNEDNVDLNRNFVESFSELPENPGYDALAKYIRLPNVRPKRLALSQLRLLRYADKYGYPALVRAVVQGQYRDPEDIYFGGASPTWSHQVLVDLCRRYLANAERVAYLDVHSGVGPYGRATPMSCHPKGSVGDKRVRDWYGIPQSPGENTALLFPKAQDSSNAVVWGASQAEVTVITLEFGTRPDLEVLGALQKENWLAHHGERSSPVGQAIQAEFIDAFYPNEDHWKRQVWADAALYIDKALRGVTGATDST